MSKTELESSYRGEPRIRFSSSLETIELVEPIGIEPMTSSLQS